MLSVRPSVSLCMPVSVRMSVRLYVWLSVRLYVCLSVCLYVRLSVRLPISLYIWAYLSQSPKYMYCRSCMGLQKQIPLYKSVLNSKRSFMYVFNSNFVQCFHANAFILCGKRLVNKRTVTPNCSFTSNCTLFQLFNFYLHIKLRSTIRIT